MRQTHDEEPLLPPWVGMFALRLAPIIAFILIYFLLTAVLNVPGKILFPVMAVVGLAALVYFGGRLYKPIYVENKQSGRCIAKGAQQRAGCRYYMPGAKLGGGCGRLMENGRCRYIKG